MTTSTSDYTASELLAVMSARLLRDGQVVFAGVGIPLLAATLAQGLHAPGLTILFEGGVIGAFIEPGRLPPSTNEQRCTWMRAISGFSAGTSTSFSPVNGQSTIFASGNCPITSDPIIERIGRNGTPIAPARKRRPTAKWLHSSNRARPLSV